MKLKEYAATLLKLAEKHPNAEVVYADDEEGNHYDKVLFHPTTGRFENGLWEPNDSTKEFKVNAVCIN